MKKRRSLLSLLMLLLLVGIPTGFLLRTYQREQANHALILAIRADATSLALDALKANADPNFRDLSDGPPSFRGYLAMLARQLRGIRPSASRTELTALALAVEKNNTVVAEALLAAGARDYGETVASLSATGGSYSLPLLFAAAQHENVALVLALAKHGWNVNAVDKIRRNALFYTENAATAKALIASGTHPDATDASGWTALDTRLLAPDTRLVQVLIDLGARDANAITVAIQNDKSRMVEMLLDQGWNLDAQDKRTGETPLIAALDATEPDATLHSDSALLLLRRGANPNCQDQKRRTPLHLAAAGGGDSEMDSASSRLVQALLEHGAKIDARNRDGMTPLMIATLHLRPTLMQNLLQHGAEVNLRDASGRTALSWARRNFTSHPHDKRHAIVIRLLKAKGATD